MRNYIQGALKILSKVYGEGSYSNRALSDADKVDNMTTKLVYGVLEKDIYLEYTLDQLLTKKPQRDIYILLKIGAYALKYLDNVPDFAIVSECVEVAKMIGKTALSGFVNAVLKKYARGEYKLPADDKSDKYLSVTNSIPVWFVRRMKKEYSDRAIEFFSVPVTTLETARINLKITTLEKVKQTLKSAGVSFEEVKGFDALLVPADETTVKSLFIKGYITFQSLSSQTAVKALKPKDGSLILDMCSAPGGKAVYMAETCPHATVLASDLYAHRVTLIEKYAHRMQINNVKTEVADGTKFNLEYADKFDYVLLDAPCSCFGTYRKHPDVFLQRGEKEITALTATQKLLIDNAIKYLTRGGELVYSTCTLFDAENKDIVEYALSSGQVELCDVSVDGEFENNNGHLRALPHGAYDGFYIAKLRKL